MSVAAWCCAGIWLYLAFFRGWFWLLREKLRRGIPSEARVTAVIPARDERDVIGRATESLRRQKFAGALRIIVADDESTDGTAQAASADLAVRVGPRPSGWKGKLWALEQGVQAETESPDYFLFTDADIEHVSPDVLASLVAKAEEGFELVSVMVRLRSESIAEKLLIPAFVFFFFKLYPPAWGSAAAGGCMLIRRRTLEGIGGIESIRDAMIDDCALAKKVKSSGGRIWLGISELEIRSIRGYGGANEIRAMIARSAFAQLNHSALLLCATVAGMLLTYVAPVVLVFTGGWAAWVISAVLFAPTVRMYRAPWWTVFCLPGIAVFYLVATIESAIRYWTGRGGEWKGRIQDV